MKSKKLPLIVSLLVAMVLSLVVAFASLSFNVKAATIVQPSTFSGNSLSLAGNTSSSPLGFRLGQGLNGAPKTIEALIKVPTTANEGSRYGVVIGNFVTATTANADCFDLEIHGGGNPRLYWYNKTFSGKDENGNANGFDWRLTNVNIATNTWTHLAFVRDTVNNKTYCYVNGELAGTYDNAGADFVPGSLAGSASGNLSIGKDNRDLVSASDTKSTYFQGNIAYIALSSSTKTQAQIQESMSNMASAKATASQGNLLFLDYASSYDYSGESFNVINGNGYGIMETLTAAPRTFEAVIKVNKTTKLAENKYGVIMGNFYSGNKANNDCFDLEIHQNGNPRLFWHNGTHSGNASDGTPNGIDWTLKNVKLNTGKWTHLAFVRDMTADKTYCYVNGVQVGTYNEAGKDIIPGTLEGSSCGNMKIGMDSRSDGDTSRCFQGEIAYVTLSSKTKTKEQIASSAKLMESCGVNKDMTTSVADIYIFDRSAARAYYRAENALPKTPNTLTATFKLPTNYALGVGGALFGNVALNASVHGFNLELNAKGHLCVVWNAHKSPNANPWVEFTSTDFRNGTWNNIAVVRDKTANCFKLYVNGVLKESSSTSTGVGDDIVGTYAPAIGSNFQFSSNERWLFKGCVKDVAVFSTALEASQISSFSSADKTKVSKENYPSMMINWVLETNQQTLYYKEDISKTITDYSGNGNNGYMCTSQHYYKPSSADWLKAEDGEYTLVFMPDTQITVSRDVEYCEKNPEVKSIADLDMTKTFQWMVDNKDAMNLSFVMHMGDLKHARGVDDNWEAQNDWREWELISGKTGYLDSMITNGSAATGTKTFSSSFINGETFGFELLKKAGVPYTMVLGNHDYDNFYMKKGGRTATYFNYYFSSASYNEKFATNVVARYDRNHEDFAQNDNTMMNVIYEIDATPKGSSTPVKYLVVALEFGPTNDMIAWANEIVSQPKYSGHRVIVNTHAMMYSDGEFMSDNSKWRPCDYDYSKDANVLEVNNGIDVYNKLIKGNDNMFMSSGGHISQETFMNRTDFGTFSNQVYSMLIDWQDTFNNRGDSLLLVAKVNENTKKITFKVYNPVLDEFYCVENQNMEWDFSDSLAREVKKDSDINYSKNNAKVGEKVEFTLNAQAGYVYAMPKVVDSFGNNVTVTKEGSNYYFTMPTSKVSISVDEIDVSTISFPTSINIDFGSSVDVSSYLNNAYTYTYSINGTSITNSGSIITAVSKGTSTLTVSIDGYGEVATCEFTTNEIVLDVPSSITLEYDGTYDIKQYLPNTYTYNYSVQGESVSVSQGVINAISTGVSTLTISINGYGEVTTCTITVKEQPLPPASSSSSSSSISPSSSSSISSSSSSSEPSSQETISSSSKEQSSSSKIESSSSQSVAISSSSAITSGGNQGGQGSATAEPSRGGCMANFGGGYTLILILVAVFACIVIFKKKA